MREPREAISAYIMSAPQPGWTATLSPTKVTNIETGETRYLGERTVIRSHEAFRPVSVPPGTTPDPA